MEGEIAELIQQIEKLNQINQPVDHESTLHRLQTSFDSEPPSFCRNQTGMADLNQEMELIDAREKNKKLRSELGALGVQIADEKLRHETTQERMVEVERQSELRAVKLSELRTELNLANDSILVAKREIEQKEEEMIEFQKIHVAMISRTEKEMSRLSTLLEKTELSEKSALKLCEAKNTEIADMNNALKSIKDSMDEAQRHFTSTNLEISSQLEELKNVEKSLLEEIEECRSDRKGLEEEGSRMKKNNEHLAEAYSALLR